jgi:hypothetical protein
MTDELYRDGYSNIWADLERLQKETAGLRNELDRVKGLLDTFLFVGSSCGRRYGQIWKRRQELRKQHGLD